MVFPLVNSVERYPVVPITMSAAVAIKTSLELSCSLRQRRLYQTSDNVHHPNAPVSISAVIRPRSGTSESSGTNSLLFVRDINPPLLKPDTAV